MTVLTKEDIKATLPFYKGEGGAEWLETNGLGGWCGSTIIGCNTRRYHGMLVAATVPPAERMNLVSKMDETLIVNGERYELGTNNYGNVLSPKGYGHLSSFNKDIFPTWTFDAGGVQLQKTVAMLYGENTVTVTYQVLIAPGIFTMQLLPLFSVRGYHALMHNNNAVHQHIDFNKGMLNVQLYDNTPGIYIKVPGANFQHQPYWFYNFNYSVEQARGLDFVEDLFSYGHFSVDLKEGDTLGIIISTNNIDNQKAEQLVQQEATRRKGLLSDAAGPQLQQILTLAADQFIVARGDNLKTVIAGYHWFTDWGRDTMISLPGLCLSTGRYDDAKKIIAAFAKSVSMGMLPNRYQDGGNPPEYNNVDGTLWYFIAIYKYLKTTSDTAFILNDILPVLKGIIDWHFKGTRYNIHVADDGLLYAGQTGQQLTWMDARIGNWVVTPRIGKPVEIEALWYNALNIFAELLALNGQDKDAAIVKQSAVKAHRSFIQAFWYAEGSYLYDVIDENGIADASVRPNQLFAVSLPFALIEGRQAEAVLQIVADKLYTPAGLRSLAPDDKNYIGIYSGNQFKRDAAYHQGTVWAWLLGPYIDALVKVRGNTGEAKVVINTLNQHLKDNCIATVPEIFDGDTPHHAKGCVAQAWSVAEILRVMKEHGLQ